MGDLHLLHKSTKARKISTNSINCYGQVKGLQRCGCRPNSVQVDRVWHGRCCQPASCGHVPYGGLSRLLVTGGLGLLAGLFLQFLQLLSTKNAALQIVILGQLLGGYLDEQVGRYVF